MGNVLAISAKITAQQNAKRIFTPQLILPGTVCFVLREGLCLMYLFLAYLALVACTSANSFVTNPSSDTPSLHELQNLDSTAGENNRNKKGRAIEDATLADARKSKTTTAQMTV